MRKLRRPCLECGEYFVPRGKFTKYCNKCFMKKQKWNNWKGLIEDEYQRALDQINE